MTENEMRLLAKYIAESIDGNLGGQGARRFTNQGNPLLFDNDTNFIQTRSGLLVQPRYVDVDLSSARSAGSTQLVLNLAGNVLYINADPNDGYANIVLNNVQTADLTEAPLYVSPGFIWHGPFTQLTVTNSAQAGKKIRIVYGTDLQIVPGTNVNSTVTVANSYLNVSAISCVSSSDRNSVSNTLNTIVTPAANTNGIYIGSAMCSCYGAGSMIRVMVKTSAPSAYNDTGAGSILACSAMGAAAHFTNLGIPIRVPAGYGLYAQCNDAVNTSAFNVGYTLL